MNTLMCRRLAAALYQVKVDTNAEFDKQGRSRQSFPEFVPDQFVVLYGIKSLAIKNINEFLYGIRENRTRKNAKDEVEPEPLLMPFWCASHHGVPHADRWSDEIFDFYADVLGTTARTVGEEHTLQLKGIGAFWNLLGSMAEIQLPVFVLLNVLTKLFDKVHPELLERLKKMTTQKAAAFAKAQKDAAAKAQKDPKNAPKPCPGYKPTVLGKPDMDSRGFLGLESFLALCMEGAQAQRDKDATILDSAYKSWDPDGTGGFDAFADCLMSAAPELPEDDLICLYQAATSGDNPDVPNFHLIEGKLRKRKIVIKRKEGTAITLDTVESKKIDDIKTISSVANLFGGGGKKSDAPPAESAASEASGSKGASRWRRAGKTAGHANNLIRSLLLDTGGVPGEDGGSPPPVRDAIPEDEAVS